MTNAQLYEKLLAARLRHALLLERLMMRLIHRIDRGGQQQVAQLRKDYDWYAASAKAISNKELVELGKAVEGEDKEDAYCGFDDG